MRDSAEVSLNGGRIRSSGALEERVAQEAHSIGLLLQSIFRVSRKVIAKNEKRGLSYLFLLHHDGRL